MGRAGKRQFQHEKSPWIFVDANIDVFQYYKAPPSFGTSIVKPSTHIAQILQESECIRKNQWSPDQNMR